MQIQIKKNDDGFLATHPTINGAFAEGSTKTEALKNLDQVVEMIIEYKKSIYSL